MGSSEEQNIAHNVCVYVCICVTHGGLFNQDPFKGGDSVFVFGSQKKVYFFLEQSANCHYFPVFFVVVENDVFILFVSFSPPSECQLD